MQSAFVNKIIPFSSVDGPGNRTSIFLQECNFNCLYCHNPETINKCKNCFKCIEKCKVEALKKVYNRVIWDSYLCLGCDECIKACVNSSTPKLKNMTSTDVVNEVKKYMSFIQGITISGGECTLNQEFLVEIFKNVKELGLNCFVDSNGSLLFEEMKELTNVMDKVMLDIKAWDNDIHQMLTGKDNLNVLKNLRYLSKINKLYEIRTVVVPNILNDYETVDKVSKFIAENDKRIRYKLIKYRPLGVRRELIDEKVPTDEYMKMLEDLAINNRCTNVLIV
jgi:pyruvate formate lyase activating enzyme